jgi:glycosyltransferase involved in cell wall biosynthesis
VGDNPYDKDYEQRLRQLAPGRVIFTGALYDAPMLQLCRHCAIYVQPSLVEGTSPMLLTAMALGRCVLVNGIRENLDVIADCGLAFQHQLDGDLEKKLEQLLANRSLRHKLGKKAQERIRQHFSWEKVAQAHLETYRQPWRKTPTWWERKTFLTTPSFTNKKTG